MAKDCFPMVAEVLAESLQVPIEEIQKESSFQGLGLAYEDFLDVLHHLEPKDGNGLSLQRGRNDRFRILYDALKSVKDLCGYVVDPAKVFADAIASHANALAEQVAASQQKVSA